MNTRGPGWVAVIFKFFAVLTVMGGVVAAVGIAASDLIDRAGVAVGVIAGTVLTAASLLFFAYVLDLLIDIRNVVDSARSAERRATGPRPGEPGSWPTGHPKMSTVADDQESR